MTQDAQTTIETTDNQPQLRPNITIDIVKRNVPRTLPCKLTDEETLSVARQRVVKEAQHDELVDDLDTEVKKRKEQIKKYADEIMAMRRELHSGYQDRTILTNECFEKDEKGNCWIVVYRNDTGKPSGERRPATPMEMQRHLPASDGSPGGLLEQATKQQRSAQPEGAEAAPATGGDVPEGLPETEDDGDDNDGKPNRRRKKAS